MIKNIITKIFKSKRRKVVKKNSIAQWKEAKGRLIPEVWPEYTPTFKLDKNDKIFTIGTCFVRTMENHLVKLGYQIPMLSFSSPPQEYPHRPNGILNKYSPASIFQELDWCEQVYLEGGRVTAKNVEKLLYACKNNQFIDLHLAAFVPVTRERALARRQEVYDVFSNYFSSQGVIITLGMIEVWQDLKTQLFIQRNPSEEMKNDMRRFVFKRLSYQECYDYVQNSISLIRKYCPDCKILITTSAVPFRETFSNEDVITANTYSKSVLRAVCGELINNNLNIDYFPAFETISLTKDWRVFDDDMRHVSDHFVKKIVNRLFEGY
jgi:hypothetical protein